MTQYVPLRLSCQLAWASTLCGLLALSALSYALSHALSHAFQNWYTILIFYIHVHVWYLEYWLDVHCMTTWLLRLIHCKCTGKSCSHTHLGMEALCFYFKVCMFLMQILPPKIYMLIFIVYIVCAMNWKIHKSMSQTKHYQIEFQLDYSWTVKCK